MSIGGVRLQFSDVRLQFSDVRLQFSDVGLGPLDIPENSSCPRYKLIAKSIIVVKVRNITVSSHSIKSQFQALHIPSLPQIEGEVERLTL